MSEQDADRQLKILSALMTIHHSIGANLELEEIGRVLSPPHGGHRLVQGV